MQLSLFQPAPVLPSGHDEPVFVKFRAALSGQVPQPALFPVIEWFLSHRVRLLITWGRRTKSGDFRPPGNGSLPVISVNRTLNEFAFLITLIHEMAHFHVWKKHGKPFLLKRRRRVQPHGKEWKEEFRQLMGPYLSPDIFPEKILTVLKVHMLNPRASTYSDPFLARILMEYDAPPAGILIEEIAEGNSFTTAAGMLFRKEEKLKKRYRCIRLKDRKIYLFSPLARVFPVEN